MRKFIEATEPDPAQANRHVSRRLTLAAGALLLGLAAACSSDSDGDSSTKPKNDSSTTTEAPASVERGPFACLGWAPTTELDYQTVKTEGVFVEGNPDAVETPVESPHRVVVSFPNRPETTEGLVYALPGGDVNVALINTAASSLQPDHEISLGLGTGDVAFVGVALESEGVTILPTTEVGVYDERDEDTWPHPSVLQTPVC